VAFDGRFALLAAIVLLAFAVEATTGFGAIVIALALGLQLYPIQALLPVLVPLGLVLSATLAWRNRAHVDGRLVLLGILPPMGVGLAAGVAIFARASSQSLERAFGVLVVAVAARELWRLARANGGEPRPLPPALRGALLLLAGVIHGVFSTGGPLLVYAVGRSGLAKARFRASLSAVWLVLGLALVAAYAGQGRIERASLLATAALVPVLGAAFAAGEWAHHRLDETRFRRAVFALLLAAGLLNLR
jgi:uncharacterized membrane protein YfcA